MNDQRLQQVMEEDRLVAELHQLGVTYLSNRKTELPSPPRSPAQILADCVRQPGSRVRTAVIALLLLKPEFSLAIPNAVKNLNPEQRQLLMLFYTAAVFLQRLYQQELKPLVAGEWSWLPDLYSTGFGIPQTFTPQEALRELGKSHQMLTHSMANWSGTYENAALHLIRYKQCV